MSCLSRTQLTRQAASPSAWRVILVALVVTTSALSRAQSDFDYAVLKSPHPENGFGVTMRVGDMDCDGFNDLVIGHSLAASNGVPFAGVLFVSHGPLLADLVEITSHSAVASETMSSQDLDLGDANGDGWPDILASASFYDSATMTNVGRAHLFFGPDFQREVILDDPTPETDGHFGASVLLLDIDGDGQDEAVVGAPQATV